jgi:hypothetical protein
MSFGLGRACRSAFRAVLFASVMLVVWAFARPAHAAWAPLCDDRGASAIAPPPLLLSPEETIARADTSGCDRDATARLAALGADHTRSFSPDAGGDAALPAPAIASLARYENGPFHAPVRPTDRPPVSPRSRVERPPRV